VRTFLSVVGARPNFMKVAPLHRAFAAYPDRIRHLILHTGQHYDERMSKVFFEELELPQPDVYLGVGSGSHAEQTARVMMAFESAILDLRPDLVIVVGDVNSTLACSVTAAKCGIPVAHVEAGLRSFDRGMPEEINRLVTDTLSDYLFVTERSGLENLRREGVDDAKVHFVGHVMIDSLVRYREKARASRLLSDLALAPSSYILVTLHRPSNVDDKDNLALILSLFESLGTDARILFPVHPRTRARMAEFGLRERFESLEHVLLTDPIGYMDFLHAMENAALVLTDSGGIQEETTYLGVPCITVRTNTERPVTVDVGTNQLLGLDAPRILEKAREALGGHPKRGMIPELWDGRAAERIAEILVRICVS
jgi:UDP-N-acetylglucosamine 2-epimerase (non-hydrolysing)